MHPILLLLLCAMVAGVPLHFADPRDFYHELEQWVIQLIFRQMSLDVESVQRLGQLVANDRFNIQQPYNKACSLMSYDRALTLLTLINTRKDLEALLLGPACLSQDIIDARRTITHMWPPTGFPLLVKKFKPKNIPTSYIKEILNQALDMPESWKSAKWMKFVEWDEMKDDLRFWRMIPPAAYYLGDSYHYQYIKQAPFQSVSLPTCQDLEMLLMKLMRIPNFRDGWRQALQMMGFDEDDLSSKFSHLQDSWSVRVVDLFKKVYSTSWEREHLPGILMDSELFKLDLWQLSASNIDVATATNDIFELFAVSFDILHTIEAKRAIMPSFESFLHTIPDWSCVRPLVLDTLFTGIWQTVAFQVLGMYVDRMIINTHALSILPAWLLTYSTSMQAHRYNLKFHGRSSLRGDFAFQNGNLLIYRTPYVDLLYQEWVRNREDWPGLVAAHERISEPFRRVFKPSKSQDGTWDPRVDEEYNQNTWSLAFQSIKFDVDYGIPSSVVPSKCFLLALLYYGKNGLDSWMGLEKEIDRECTFPKRKIEQARYQTALGNAQGWFFYVWPPLPKANVERLQASIRGEIFR